MPQHIKLLKKKGKENYLSGNKLFESAGTDIRLRILIGKIKRIFFPRNSFYSIKNIQK